MCDGKDNCHNMKKKIFISLLILIIAAVVAVKVVVLKAKEQKQKQVKPAPLVLAEQVPKSEKYPSGARKAVFSDVTLIIPHEYSPGYYDRGADVEYSLNESGDIEPGGCCRLRAMLQPYKSLPQSERLSTTFSGGKEMIRQSKEYPQLLEIYHIELKRPTGFLMPIASGEVVLIGCGNYKKAIAFVERDDHPYPMGMSSSCNFPIYFTEQVDINVRFDPRLLPVVDKVYQELVERINGLIVEE